MREMKQISAECIPVLYRNIQDVLEYLGVKGTLVLTGSGAYVGIMEKISEKDHPIHDLDLKLIPENPIKAIEVLTALSTLTGKECYIADYFTIKGEPVRYDFMFNDIPVNIWLMIEPVRYNVITTKLSKYCGPIEIPVESLDDIFIAKAKMNRPKDVRDIKNIAWANVEAQSTSYDNILHPWVLDREEKLTPSEKSYVHKAEVIMGYYGKSVRFTFMHQYFAGKVKEYDHGWQYITIDEHCDNYDDIQLGEVSLDDIRIVYFKRFNAEGDTCIRCRIVNTK